MKRFLSVHTYPSTDCSFSIQIAGRTRSGFYWHVHGPAITGLLFGHKRWFFYRTEEIKALPKELRKGFHDDEGLNGLVETCFHMNTPQWILQNCVNVYG